MFKMGIFALIVAVIAGLLGFTGIAGAAATFSKIVFAIALILFLVAFFIARQAV